MNSTFLSIWILTSLWFLTITILDKSILVFHLSHWLFFLFIAPAIPFILLMLEYEGEICGIL